MQYIIAKSIKQFCHNNGKQITHEAIIALDKKIEDFLYKLVRLTNGNHRIVPEIVNIIKL